MNKNEAPSVVLNEICANNKTVIRDGIHDECDYIELYNGSSDRVSLDGWYLSDDPEEPKKFMISDVDIKPKSHVMFYGAGTDVPDSDCLNFKIDSAGEKIFLSDSEGKIVDTIYVPEVRFDTAYARVTDGGNGWENLEATPGTSNNKAEPVPNVSLEKPVFSHTSGFYDDEFVLNISAENGAKIYYTTDGSIPTEKSEEYLNGILIRNVSDQPNYVNAQKRVVADWMDYEVPKEPVDKGVVVRAVAVDDHGNYSRVVTETFFVDLKKYENCNIISVVAEPEELFGDEGILVTGKAYDELYLESEMSEDGIFELGWTDNIESTNFYQRGRSWEVEGNFQYFNDGKELINQEAGIRTQGNYTSLFAVKGLQILSRATYSGSDVFQDSVFEEQQLHALILATTEKKAYYLELAQERNLGYQQTAQSCPVFLNGEYWYTAVIMEKYDELFFEQHYGVDGDNVIFVKDMGAALGKDAGYLYREFKDFLRNPDLTNEEKCRQLQSMVDIQSFIDWVCFHLYLSNDDVHFDQNHTLWRSISPDNTEYGDCRWRWLIYDMDHALLTENAAQSRFSDLKMFKKNPLYDVLKTDDSFCRQFVLTFMDMANTCFSVENAEQVLQKSGLDISHQNYFFRDRFDYAADCLKEEFDLSGTIETVNLSINFPEAGKIKINTSEITEKSWQGRYFTDYLVKITAETNPGYRFVGWIGDYDGTEETLEIEISEGGISLEAVFEKE